MRTFELDYVAGTAPLVVTARLFGTVWTTWRWTLNGEINQPIDGWSHTFVLQAGTYQISVRGVLPDGTVQQDESVRVTVVSPEAYWRMQTFGWINEAEATGLEQRKWTGVRVEGTDYDVVMEQCRAHGFRPLWILAPDEHKTCPGNIDVEIGNEQNDGCGAKWPRLTPAEYASWVMAAWPTLRDKGCVVYVGAANNTSVAGLAWTKDVLSRLPFHPNLRGSIHRYMMNPKDQRPDVPQKGHKSISSENAAITDCFRGRRWGLSETGIMDVEFRDWSSWKYFGKKQIRRAVDGHRYQAARFKDLGADFYVVYQIHSGGDDLYGQFVNGQWSATSNLPLEAV